MDEPSKEREEYQRVKKIFQAVIKLAPKERTAFLERECGGDEELRCKLTSLLEADDSRFMEEPVVFQLAELIVEGRTERERTNQFETPQAGDEFGHYKIIKQIGKGGMGEVFLARDEKLNRQVAIKFLVPEYSQDTDRLNRFIQEAKAASALNHPNILTIHEIEEVEGIHFIATEYIAGEDLSRLISEEKIPLESVLKISIQIVSALKVAHQAGIIHRDIKPDNIKVRKDGLVKVLDFGLAKLTEKPTAEGVDLEADTIGKISTIAGMIMGTPNYMSPEQARGKKTDGRTDIFSFGIVLYEMLAGEKPFRGETTADIIIAVIQETPPPIGKIVADLPAELERLVDRTLCKTPDGRYQTAGELLVDLERIKKRLQFENELDRLKPPKRMTGEEPVGQTTLIRRGTKTLLKKAHTDNRSTRLTESAEYIINQIKTHKSTTFLILATLLIGWAGFFYWQVNRAFYEPLPEAKIWYEKGRTAFDDGLLLVAKNNFGEAIERDKNYVMAHAGLARTFNELGYIEDARLTRELANDINQSNQLPLSDRDSIHLQAINKTLLLDFSSAVEKYRELTEYALPTEKAHAFSDLGKAHEQNENLPDALASYQTALSLNPDLASANLHLGILYGRQQKYEEAEAYLSKAENLYRTQQNSEGEIEAINHLGRMLSGKGDSDEEALGKVKVALEKARINEIPYQQVNCLRLISQILRSMSETKKAVPYGEEAVLIARLENLRSLEAQSLQELGTVHFFMRNNQEAEKFYNEALLLARQDKADLIEKRILLQLGAFYIQQHRADDALKFIEKVVEFFEKGGYKKDLLDVLSIKGQALAIKGDFTTALELYKNLANRADQAGDLVIKARAKKGIGTMSANLDELSTAAPELYESYSIFNSIDRTMEAGYSLLAYADVSLQLGDFEKAYSSLNLAEGIAQEQKWLIPRTDVLRAKLALSERKFPEAIRLAQKIIDEDTTGKIVATFEARTILALAYSNHAQKEKGKKIIEQLFKDEIEDDDLPTMARGYLIHSEVMLENTLSDKAIESALKTQEILKKLGKPSLEWRAWLLLSLAQNQLQDVNSAKQSAAKADEIFSTLAQKWGPEDFQSYSERPDIKYYRQLLEEFTTIAK